MRLKKFIDELKRNKNSHFSSNGIQYRVNNNGKLEYYNETAGLWLIHDWTGLDYEEIIRLARNGTMII